MNDDKQRTSNKINQLRQDQVPNSSHICLQANHCPKYPLQPVAGRSRSITQTFTRLTRNHDLPAALYQLIVIDHSTALKLTVITTAANRASLPPLDQHHPDVLLD